MFCGLGIVVKCSFTTQHIDRKPCFAIAIAKRDTIPVRNLTEGGEGVKPGTFVVRFAPRRGLYLAREAIDRFTRTPEVDRGAREEARRPAAPWLRRQPLDLLAPPW